MAACDLYNYTQEILKHCYITLHTFDQDEFGHHLDVIIVCRQTEKFNIRLDI